MKNYLYRFWLQAQKKYRIYQPVIGTPLPSVSPIRPFILPFVDQSGSFISLRRNGGFSLMELMMVLVVVAILVGFALPNMSDFMQNTRVTTQTNDLVADLNLARSEAIKRSANIGICKLPAGATAPPCSISGKDWSNGRVIFIDANGDGQATGDEILRTREASDAGVTLRGDDRLANFVLFTRLGMTTLGAPSLFVVCGKSQKPNVGRSITVETTGRATITKGPTVTTCTP
jgi:type IV fimbrial biogenesis protein FimT